MGFTFNGRHPPTHHPPIYAHTHPTTHTPTHLDLGGDHATSRFDAEDGLLRGTVRGTARGRVTYAMRGRNEGGQNRERNKLVVRGAKRHTR